uniref:ABC transporter permease subunit n=1 Tax=Streptomyces sp. NBC_01393 TaxID=2903851 RepID=A0AAU3I165_9ACTN
MSTPTLHRPSGPSPYRPPRPSPYRPSGLTWTVLRLHRTALYAWGAALLIAVAALIWLLAIGPEARATLGGCDASDPFPMDCRIIQRTLAARIYASSLALVSACVTYLMYAVAVWAGAALIGRELENGTARLAWTQSVTPARWLAAKLAVPAVLLTAGTALAVLLGNWTRRAGNAHLSGGWFNTNVFVSSGPVAVAYALAGLALGALAGLVLRRALPAAAAALAAVYVLHEVLNRFRMNLWPAETATGRAALQLPHGTLVLEHGAVTGSGERLSNNMACVGTDSAAALEKCVRGTGLTDFWTTYHPESHFWPLQLMESGLLLAVTGLAAAAAFALLRRQHS